MKTHELKILPEYFEAVKKGKKNFEIRKNDRDFQVGDILRLKEYDGEKYTGEETAVTVTYILKEFEALKQGYCILSIKRGRHYETTGPEFRV